MKILLIGDHYYSETVISKVVKTNLTSRNNIIVVHNIESAKTFISNNVVGKSYHQHIDLIIVDDIIEGNRYQKNFCDWLRDSNESFSDSNFRISSIPIILHKANISDQEIRSTVYNAILPFSNDDDLRIVTTSRRVVKDWREAILNDLSMLNLDLKRLESFSLNLLLTDYNKISRKHEFYYSITEILSREFIQHPKAFRNDWFTLQLSDIEESIDKYGRILKNALRYNGKAYERQVLHRFYLEHPFFLTRDTFANQIYDKRYYISSTSHFHIPDFILVSPFPGYTNTSISEIKRQNISFQYNPKRHQNFTNYTRNALDQASNYQDDFQESNLFNDKCQMDLIIGRDEGLNPFVLKKFAKHYSTINIVTHDRLKKEVEFYYDRKKQLLVTA